MKTRKEYEKEIMALDEELFEIQARMEELEKEFVDNYGIFEWEEMLDLLRHTA